jgi:uncharacterized membrane protein
MLPHKKHSEAHDDDSNHNKLSTARLEAFSDGVMAIIITITVLELKVPLGHTFADLKPLLPLFITYIVSFQAIGTYWNNHHHLLRVTKHVSTGIMWSNLNLLFWMSLIPFGAGWLGENHGSGSATVLYSLILLMCAIAYFLLQWQVLKHATNREQLIKEFNKSPKGTVSLVLYAAAVLVGAYYPIVADIFIVLVSVMWFIPDRRIEKYL